MQTADQQLAMEALRIPLVDVFIPYIEHLTYYILSFVYITYILS